ncbi:stage II sporulation protein P, partial [[Eubacterium] rectale]
RYNMHLCPKSLLGAVGAQTNTKEEAYNAMERLADILDKVLK